MENKTYFNNSKGEKISFVLSRPVENNNSNKSIVIMCHGLNSNKDSRTHLALSKIFLQKNIATFRFDFYAHGDSEGKIDNRTIEEFVDEVIMAIKYVKDIGYTQIGLCGTSIGGATATIAASKSKDIKALSLKAAGMGQTSRKMTNYKHNFDNKTWIKAGEKIQIPTIIIHGAEDKDVEPELGKELAKAIKTSKLLIYEKADHRFTKEEDFNQSIKDIAEFFIKEL